MSVREFVDLILHHTVSLYTLTHMKISYFNKKLMTLPVKLYRLIQMCSNEIYNKVCMSKN
jgi:hypothetical protein